MLPLVSEKLWDTKRWAFLSGRNRTIRPWNRKESVRCMRKLKAFKDLKELVRVVHIFSCKWVRIQCPSHVRNHCLAFYTKFSKVKYIIPMLIPLTNEIYQYLLSMPWAKDSDLCLGSRPLDVRKAFHRSHESLIADWKYVLSKSGINIRQHGTRFGTAAPPIRGFEYSHPMLLLQNRKRASWTIQVNSTAVISF